MVINALQINSYVLAKSAKIRSVDERWHLRSANSASITSPSHWPSNGDVWARECHVWRPQGLSYSMNAVVHIGKQRLYKPRDCHQILSYSRTKRRPAALPCENSHLFPNRVKTAKRRPAVLSTVRKCEWWSRSTGASAHKLFERIVCRRRDMQRPIPNTRDGGSTSEWPFLQTNLFVVTNSTISFQVFFASWSTSRSFSRRLQQRWPLRSGSACYARDVTIYEHAIRTRPSCCGFWNLIALAWKFPQAYGAFLVMR